MIRFWEAVCLALASIKIDHITTLIIRGQVPAGVAEPGRGETKREDELRKLLRLVMLRCIAQL
jgi:hypothetical protein